MVPGVEIEQMFKNVRVRVLRDTAGRQLPWVNTSLTSNFTFNPGRAAAAQGTREPQPGRLQESVPAVAPSSEPSAATREQPKDKDVDTLLARLRREAAAASAQPPPVAALPPAAAPSSSATAAPAVAPPAPPPRPAPAPQVAMAAPQSASASATAPTVETRKFLGRDELQQILVGKTHLLKDSSVRYLMRWDVRSGGLIYYNSESPGTFGTNGSGRWELKDDGSFCVRFNSPGVFRPTDARVPDDGCWYFFRQGGTLARISVTTPQGQPQFEVVDVK